MPEAAKTQRSWTLALFGLPFFCIGIGFLLFSVIPTLHDAWRMASWPETQGTLLQAQLTANHSSKSTTYDVSAEYRYEVAGRSYRGNRVAIGSGGDNIGDFQQTLGNRLETALQNEQPVSVWYDPDNPGDAVLDRSPRWGLLGFKMIFVIAFGGAGSGLLFVGLRGSKTATTAASSAQPWLQRPEWQGSVIQSSAKTGLYFAWGFTLMWNLISIPVAFFIPDIWRETGASALFVLLFPAIGLGLLVWAVKATLEWRRFGATPLAMDPFPGAIGGDVGGEIRINIPYQASAAFEVTLSCINSYVTGSGKNRSRSEKVVWQDKGYAEAQAEMRGTRLQFRFEVPDGLPGSEASSDNYHLWRLNLHGDLPGVDLERSFELPAYPGLEKSRHITALSTQYQPPGIVETGVAALLPLAQSGNRVDIHYPVLRKPLGALATLLFGGIFSGVGAFLWKQAALEGFPLNLMGGVFSVIGWLAVLGGLYALSNSLHVQFDGHALTAVRRILGMPVSSKSVSYTQIRSIEAKQSGSSQTGNTHHINYQVIAKTASGDIVLTEGLDAQSKTERVVEYFKELTGTGGDANAAN